MDTKAEMHSNCYRQIIQKGIVIAVVRTSDLNKADGWLKSVAGKAKALVDWTGHEMEHEADMHVYHLGGAESRQRVDKAMDDLENTLDGKILFRSPSPYVQVLQE